MGSTRAIQLVCLLLAAAALVGAIALQGRLDFLRREMETSQASQIATSEYPELKLLQALPGGVRALLIDYLWIRSENLKQKGKFFDAVQLANMICSLEARFPGVWGYHAWNLSYNISVETHTPAERWYWVKAGIELLRDEGLKYNPKSLDLYRELSWIYFHKIGERTDEMHLYYKRYLAAEYQRVLGSPPHIGGMDAYRAWLTPILDAPDRLEDLVKDADAAAFVAEAGKAGLTVDLALLDAYNAWSDDPAVRLNGQGAAEPASDSQKNLRLLMSDEKWAAGRAKVVAFARKHVIRDTYKLQPFWMREMMEYYGPLDWRLAQTHCLYWSTFGIEHIKGLTLAQLYRLETVPTDNGQVVPVLNTHRNVLNCLKQMAFYGRIVLTYNPANPDLPELLEQPDWRFIEIAHQEHIRRKEHLLNVHDNKTYDAFIPGHVNFLSDAIIALYLRGRTDDAQKFFRYVHDTYKKDELDWNLPLHDYVWRQVRLEGRSTRQTASILTMGLIENAFQQGLMGYRDDMNLAMDTAAQVRNEYDTKTTERNKLDSMPQMQAEVAYGMMASLPASVAMELYAMLPVGVQRAIYDPLGTYMPDRCKQERLDYAKAFPEPEGMDGYRQRRQEFIEQHSTPRQKMAGEGGDDE
jgi:hypothetical protein